MFILQHSFLIKINLKIFLVDFKISNKPAILKLTNYSNKRRIFIFVDHFCYKNREKKMKIILGFLTFCKADFCSLKTNEEIIKVNLTKNGVCDFGKREIEFFYDLEIPPSLRLLNFRLDFFYKKL